MIHITMYSDKALKATADDDDPQRYYQVRHLQALPEIKYHADGYWIFPVTEPNVDALRQMRDVEYDEDAANFVRYATLTIQLAQAREKRRWKYLFDDPTLSCSIDRIPDDGVVHKVVEAEGETRSYHLPKESFRHQIVGLDAVHGQEYFAMFMEMGTGKTKVIIDEIALAALEKPLKVLLIVPKTIMGTWDHELAKWLPENLDWVSERLWTGEEGMRRLIQWARKPNRLRIILCNYDRLQVMKDALMTIHFDIAVCDESSRLKNPSAKRTKAAVEIAPTCDRRFIMSGSPVVGSVLDFFSQYEFLSPASLGYSTFYAFKAHYANLSQVKNWQDDGHRYRNLDELKRRVARHAFIVKKEQCLDLPEKLYQVITVQMGRRQREVYEQMVELFLAEIEMEAGANGVVEARSTLAKLLRLAQITQGFVKNTGPDGDGQYADIGDGDGKLVELMRILAEDIPQEQKVVVWARFTRDILHITDACLAAGIEFLVLNGATPQAQRDTIEADFNDGPCHVLIGEPATGGLGLTLLGNKDHPCHTHIYYSNDYSLEKRIQSEDRSHRIGQIHPVLYIDIVCAASIDEHIAGKLQTKRDLSESMKDMTSIRAMLLGNRAEIDEGREE